MLTGKKWGHTFDLEDGATVEFDDATEVIAITSIDADFGPQTSLLCDGGAFVLYKLLSEHFSDGWTPCGPDGPFPPVGVEVDVTCDCGEWPNGIKRHAIGRDFRSNGKGGWINWMNQEVAGVIAWAYPRKPYEPKGQA